MTTEWNSFSEESKAPHRAQTEVQKKRYEREIKLYKEQKAALLASQPATEPEPTPAKPVKTVKPKTPSKKRPATEKLSIVIPAPPAPNAPTTAATTIETPLPK